MELIVGEVAVVNVPVVSDQGSETLSNIVIFQPFTGVESITTRSVLNCDRWSLFSLAKRFLKFSADIEEGLFFQLKPVLMLRNTH